MVVWFYGCAVLWLVVRWCGGVVVWWCGGVVVWWCGGVVAWWVVVVVVVVVVAVLEKQNNSIADWWSCDPRAGPSTADKHGN